MAIRKLNELPNGLPHLRMRSMTYRDASGLRGHDSLVSCLDRFLAEVVLFVDYSHSTVIVSLAVY